MSGKSPLYGIHAATVAPLKDDFRVDHSTLKGLIVDICSIQGIEGFLINGHAGEHAQLSSSEKTEVIKSVCDVVSKNLYITSGVYSENTLQAVKDAENAEHAGADALLVFPPNGWALGQERKTILAHHRAISDATELPLLLYQAPVFAGQMAYDIGTLLELATIDSVIGVKEGSWEVARYDANRRALKAQDPEFIVLGSGDEHLLVSYMMGSDGSQVSLATVVPEMVVALWDAANSGEWEKAKRLHNVMYPLSTAIYGAVPGRANARLKACLKILGKLPSDLMRPPTQPLPTEEYQTLEAALNFAREGFEKSCRPTEPEG